MVKLKQWIIKYFYSLEKGLNMKHVFKKKAIIWFFLSLFFVCSQYHNLVDAQDDMPPKSNKIEIETTLQKSLLPLLKKIISKKQKNDQTSAPLLERGKKGSVSQLLSILPQIRKELLSATCDNFSIEKNNNVIIPTLKILKET